MVRRQPDHDQVDRRPQQHLGASSTRTTFETGQSSPSRSKDLPHHRALRFVIGGQKNIHGHVMINGERFSTDDSASNRAN